jgi:predicted component of type VI protein secretion system
MLSGLTNAACDLSTLQSSLAKGALQITLPNGYVLARRNDDLLDLEFKSHDDAAPCKVTLRVDEVENRLEELQSQAIASVV